MNVYPDFNSLLYATAKQILSEGLVVSPRGVETREIIGWTACLPNSRARVCTLKGRKWDPSFSIAEMLWYLRGSNSVDEIKFWAPHMVQYSDDGIVFHGAYGFRVFEMYNTVKRALDKLRLDPDSRQAVVPIFEPRDVFQLTKDLPCTLIWHFMIRDGKLDMVVDMRSNDLFTGTTNDIFAFTMIQEWAARQLGIEPGRYFHHSHSMHIYTDKLDKVGRWAQLDEHEAWEPVPPMEMMPVDKDVLAIVVASLQADERLFRELSVEVSAGETNLDTLLDEFRRAVIKNENNSSWGHNLRTTMALGALQRVKTNCDEDRAKIMVFAGWLQNKINDQALFKATVERFGYLLAGGTQL